VTARFSQCAAGRTNRSKQPNVTLRVAERRWKLWSELLSSQSRWLPRVRPSPGYDIAEDLNVMGLSSVQRRCMDVRLTVMAASD